MKLAETDARLTKICRTIERHTERESLLANRDVPVEVKADFRDQPEVREISTFQKTPAAYRKSTGVILINEADFFKLDEGIQEAVLAHEVGHIICNITGCPDAKKNQINECVIADVWACRWGYWDDLKRERIHSYGEEYCAILNEWWSNEQAFFEKMRNWNVRKLAGL